ncbi:hypothetical protein E2C01_035592 [Portunus trituberculatus]|uniref:Uncharacterized protein n=1 Tax=Portunus trituberculatus TaxID=210409 RepID=A0A5B7F4L3_PORTR|nr:hypothetical protein [Portunus trituberculatus]
MLLQAQAYILFIHSLRTSDTVQHSVSLGSVSHVGHPSTRRNRSAQVTISQVTAIEGDFRSRRYCSLRQSAGPPPATNLTTVLMPGFDVQRRYFFRDLTKYWRDLPPLCLVRVSRGWGEGEGVRGIKRVSCCLISKGSCVRSVPNSDLEPPRH